MATNSSSCSLVEPRAGSNGTSQQQMPDGLITKNAVHIGNDEMALTKDFKETVRARAQCDPDFHAALLIEAAERLGLDLVFLSRDVLRQQAPFVRTRSLRTESLFGIPSVAEAAALAGAGADAVLLVPRIAGQGATCAVAGSRDAAS